MASKIINLPVTYVLQATMPIEVEVTGTETEEEIIQKSIDKFHELNFNNELNKSDLTGIDETNEFFELTKPFSNSTEEEDIEYVKLHQQK